MARPTRRYSGSKSNGDSAPLAVTELLNFTGTRAFRSPAESGGPREAGPLKIATFNINNINKRLHNLTAWLAREQPDVVCLQELKVEQRAFPASALRDLGYRD